MDTSLTIVNAKSLPMSLFDEKPAGSIQREGTHLTLVKEISTLGKVLTFLGASLGLALVVPVVAQDKAPDMFKDADTSHWAYAAMESLRAKNIVIGYPDGMFRGRRTLTRYEFAVALDRALKSIKPAGDGTPGPAGPAGPAGQNGADGATGAKGAKGDSGMTPEEVATLRRLTNEFKDELASLGNNITSINKKLDDLAGQVKAINARLDKMPTLYGGLWVGMRSDISNGGYTDYDGRTFGAGGSNSLVNTPAIVHQFVLGVKANIAGGAKLDAAITSNNYLNYLGGNEAQIGGLNLNPAADTYIHHAQITTPFAAIGRGSELTIGRFGEKLGHLTLWKPSGDREFQNPFENTGDYYIDGLRLTTNFGSVSTQILAAKVNSVQGTNGGAWNAPLAGATFGGIFGGNFKPTAQAGLGQMTVDQIYGIDLGVKTGLLGHDTKLGATALALTSSLPGSAGAGFTDTLVLGGNLATSFGSIGLDADYAKSITGKGRFNTVGTKMNNAINANLNGKAAGFNVMAGYRYIDPLFYTPGYWGRIGNWLNPTNIQGPRVSLGRQLSSNVGLNLSGDFYKAAHNQALSGGIGGGDEITRVLARVKWDVTKSFALNADWEGVFWKLTGAHSGIPALGTGTVHPTEHYLTLGTGYNLTSNTQLKFAYTLGDFNGHGALNGGSGTTGNYNSVTTQVAVKF